MKVCNAVHRVARSRRDTCVVRCAHGMETEADTPAEAVLCAVVAHAGATLGARDVASAAGVSRACRAAAGPHGVMRAELGSKPFPIACERRRRRHTASAHQ